MSGYINPCFNNYDQQSIFNACKGEMEFFARLRFGQKKI